VTPQEAESLSFRSRLQQTPIWRWLACAALFSAVVNLLLLTGPLFMLLVYDRVIPSNSVETLVSLLCLTAFFYAMQAVLDICRARLMARCALCLQAAFGARLFAASFTPSGPARAQQAMSALDATQKLLSAPVALAVMDLPWVPLFLFGVFLLHPALGLVAIAGAALLAAVTVVHHSLARDPAQRAGLHAVQSEQTAAQAWNAIETVRGLGMSAALLDIWLKHRQIGQQAALRTADLGAVASACARDLRLLMQSTLLATGAWLCMSGKISSGAMVASSILVGRSLAPVEGLIAGWSVLRRGILGFRQLRNDHSDLPSETARTSLPRPSGHYHVDSVSVRRTDGRGMVLDKASFQLHPRQILGVVGPSGAGKSTLLRIAAGLIPPDFGSAQLDGAHLGQYSDIARSGAIGYLPQRIDLFRGTIADNIRRLQSDTAADAVVAAATRAGADQMIRSLPDGYDTIVDPLAPTLSGGQMHRIALARAFFGCPSVLCLDEPDAALDAHGVAALLDTLQTHRDAGGTTILASHRPSVLAICDLLLSLNAGAVHRFGPRDSVLRDLRLMAPAQPSLARVRRG
jgi:ATP-binding cassette subfamily C protein